MKRTLIVSLVILVSAATALGHWPIVKNLTCPICAHKFTWRSVWSGFLPPPRLDLKPNDVADVWKIPECTQCGFVFYRDDIDPNEISGCAILAKSEEFRRIRARPSYYRLGRLYEHLGKNGYDTGMAFLRASWQEEGRAKPYRENLDKCLFHLRRSLTEAAEEKKADADGNWAGGPAWHRAQLLIGEILRLKGEHEDAIRHFESLISTEGFLALHYGEVVIFELELCRNKDSKPHSYDELREGNIQNLWQALKGYGVNLDARDNIGQTPLHQAAWLGHKEMVQLLLQSGAKVNTVMRTTGHGATACFAPLHNAVIGGRSEVGKVLLANGADPNAKDGRGLTPLDHAAMRGDRVVFEILNTTGAEGQYELRQ